VQCDALKSGFVAALEISNGKEEAAEYRAGRSCMG